MIQHPNSTIVTWASALVVAFVIVLIILVLLPIYQYFKRKIIIRNSKKLNLTDKKLERLVNRISVFSKYHQLWEQDLAKEVDLGYVQCLIKKIESGKYQFKSNRVVINLPYLGTFREMFVEHLLSEYNIAISRGQIHYLFGIPTGIKISIYFRR